MDQLLMDKVQLISWIIAMIAAITTALLAISSFRKSIRERKRDLLWKQANVAKDFMNEVLSHKYSGKAILMLDWFIINTTDFVDTSKTTQIKYQDVLEAIPKIATKTYNETEKDILDCFDWLLYYIDRTEQYILDGLFLFDNVKYIYYPYYKIIYQQRSLYESFMKDRCYFLAPDFFKRFETETVFEKYLNDKQSANS